MSMTAHQRHELKQYNYFPTVFKVLHKHQLVFQRFMDMSLGVMDNNMTLKLKKKCTHLFWSLIFISLLLGKLSNPTFLMIYIQEFNFMIIQLNDLWKYIFPVHGGMSTSKHGLFLALFLATHFNFPMTAWVRKTMIGVSSF